MKLNILPTQLQLKDTFTISRGSIQVRQTVIVSLEDGEHTGYGEACEQDYYGIELQALIDDVESVRSVVEQYEWPANHSPGMPHPPEDLWEKLAPKLSHNFFALCAIDMAAWDLYGKKIAQPLYKIWNLKLDQMPATDYTIGIDKLEKMLSKMREFPFPTYKIKLGTDHDMEIMRAIRRQTNARLRIDANCGWTAGQAIMYSHQLRELGVEFIEQPLPADEWKAMKEVYKNTVLPLYADESCVREEDVAKCPQHFHGINIKLMKCGGITPARRMIKKARQLNLKVMMGCMTESSVGISAIAHFLPLLDHVDMDGTLLISNDPATGVSINQDGSVSFPNINGTGVRLKELMY